VDCSMFDAGPFALQCGTTLSDCRLGYTTHGTLNAARDNVIVYPTRYAGTHVENMYLVGRGMALDPDKYFIVIPNMLGNGASSSPSNQPAPFDGPRFPPVTQYDNVRLQERMLREVFGIERIALAVGWSMGGQQAFQWASLFPDRVARMACIAGSAITTPHCFTFLEGPRNALIADAHWNGGEYETPPYKGLTAKARVWSAWALSPEWYKRELWTTMGYGSLDEYLSKLWDPIYFKRDANDLLSMIRTWQLCDLGNNPVYGGDRAKSLGAITARAFLMPSRTDLYFRPEDNAAEAALMPNAELRVIESVWGHYAGGGRNAADTAFIDANLKELLAA
jgi:homoserine O-acetyltransferase/O-succinyltransferase